MCARYFTVYMLLYNWCCRDYIIRLLTSNLDIIICRIIETVRDKTQMFGSSRLHNNDLFFTWAILRIIVAETYTWFHVAVSSTIWPTYSAYSLFHAVFFYSINSHIIYWRVSFEHLRFHLQIVYFLFSKGDFVSPNHFRHNFYIHRYCCEA